LKFLFSITQTDIGKIKHFLSLSVVLGHDYKPCDTILVLTATVFHINSKLVIAGITLENIGKYFQITCK